MLTNYFVAVASCVSVFPIFQRYLVRVGGALRAVSFPTKPAISACWRAHKMNFHFLNPRTIRGLNEVEDGLKVLQF